MILALETSTKNCSVALIEGEEIVVLKEAQSDQYIHSEKLHLFIEEALADAQVKPKDLRAIAVGAGPGSYTGLRIGVASAKALAYSLSIPLLSAKGSELLLEGLLMQMDLPSEALVHPMIDARRMEVYTATYEHGTGQWTELKAEILSEEAYQSQRPHYFIGDGAVKAMQVYQSQQHNFPDLIYPSAGHFKHLAERLLREKRFEDVAYFEPFYLKEFVAHRPKSLF